MACMFDVPKCETRRERGDVLPLWEGTKEVGRLRLSLAFAALPGLPEPSSARARGLTNLAAGGASLVNHSGAVNAGGLLNRASASEESETRPSFARGASGLVNCAPPPAASSGLRNVVESIPQARSSSKEAAESRPSFARGASQGLANLAVREDGSRPTAVPHALELLAEVPAFDPGSDVHKRKLAQALESLRKASAEDLQGALGRQALAECAPKVEACQGSQGLQWGVFGGGLLLKDAEGAHPSRELTAVGFELDFVLSAFKDSGRSAFFHDYEPDWKKFARSSEPTTTKQNQVARNVAQGTNRENLIQCPANVPAGRVAFMTLA
ncbi:unnamed protein product [Symbiodinium sp. CCMP2592]|nr:unnamed protein product [Symbiodinium sp. CCMP2592]